MELKGTGISGGIVFGRAFIYAPGDSAATEEHFADGGADDQLKKWDAAKSAAAAELRALADGMSGDPDKAKIFAAHLELLGDEDIDGLVREAVTSERCTAQWAAQRTFDEFAQMLAKSKNALIAERAADLRDVCARVVRLIRGGGARGLGSLPGPVIVVSHDLLPSDTATLDRKNVLAIVTETGGATSHSAILAESMRIPAVLGVLGALDAVAAGCELIVDADDGVVVSPDEKQREALSRRKEQSDRRCGSAEQWVSRAAALKSGEAVAAGVNIGGASNADGLENADFVGLFRTEFLYMDSDHLPTEDEQTEAYSAVLRAMNGKTVTLRTLDIGGDKTLKYKELPREANPFLGRRAVRLCFDEPDIFRTQLRAAYRASVCGSLSIMFPMVGSMDDWRRARDFALAVRAELIGEGVPVADDVKLGIMIEIPSVAMIADIAAREVDFASIGTNDLCQYLCAADRMEPSVREYYQSYSPAFIRTLARIIGAFNAAGKEISMCGEIAGDPKASALLAGLGLRKFSMTPSALGRVKLALSKTTLAQSEALAAAAMDAETQADVLRLLQESQI